MATQTLEGRGAENTEPSITARADDLRSFITFVRNDPTDCGQRQVYVRIDGDKLVTLIYGDVIEVEMRPGKHKFRINNTLFLKYINIGIEPGERLRCRIINSARWWTAGIVSVFGAAPLFLSVEILSE